MLCPIFAVLCGAVQCCAALRRAVLDCAMSGPCFACAGLPIVDSPQHAISTGQCLLGEDLSVLVMAKVCGKAAACIELLNNAQLGAAAARIHL